MADSDRVVYPDEVETAKAEALEKAAEQKVEEVESNSIETPENVQTPQVAMRNLIVVPGNCPEGYKMGADGVCREIF